ETTQARSLCFPLLISLSPRQQEMIIAAAFVGGRPRHGPASREAEMTSPVGRTARWVAASRARETERPDRLFEDPYAAALAGPEGVALLGTDPDHYLPIRTRFLDDAILRAVNELALQQVVLLAAGLDARAFRLPWPPGLHLFELDREEVLNPKEETLRRLGATPACTQHVVVADLAGTAVPGRLRPRGTRGLPAGVPGAGGGWSAPREAARGGPAGQLAGCRFPRHQFLGLPLHEVLPGEVRAAGLSLAFRHARPGRFPRSVRLGPCRCHARGARRPLRPLALSRRLAHRAGRAPELPGHGAACGLTAPQAPALARSRSTRVTSATGCWATWAVTASHDSGFNSTPGRTPRGDSG